MADEGNDPLLRPDGARGRTGQQIRPFVLLVVLLSVLALLLVWAAAAAAAAGGGGGDRDGVGWADGRHGRRIRGHAGVQAVRVLPVWVFLCLAQQHHGYAVAGGIRDVRVRGGRVGEDVVIRAKQRLLDLRDGQLLGRRGICRHRCRCRRRHRRTGVPQCGREMPLWGRREV